MEWLQQLLESSSTPIVTALLLGLLTAISPCPLATNITAVGFISKDVENPHRIFWNGVLYTVGRIITYTVIGFIVIPILREGASIYMVQKIISKYGEMLVAPALLAIGFFMLFGDRLNISKFTLVGSEKAAGFKRKGSWGALILGILFSIAFCPSSGIFYFGILIPMAAVEATGYMLPPVFAIATGVPVIIVAWILAYSVAGIGKFYHKIRVIQKRMNLITAILFILIGIYYLIMIWL